MTSGALNSSQYKEYLPASKSTQYNSEQFRTDLEKLLPHAGFHKLYPKPPISPEVRSQCCLPNPSVCFHDSLDINSDIAQQYMLNYEKDLHFDSEVVERLTRGQRNNDIWAEARKCRLTASNFGAIVNSQKRTSVLKTVMGYYGYVSSDAIEWGKKREKVALSAYLKEMNNDGKKVSVSESGLLISEEYPFLGASPDGVVRQNGEIGLVEIKCPYKHRQVTPYQASDDKTFCCVKDVNGNVTLKKNHKYFYQIQGQMAIKGCNWCDFVVWTTKGLVIERVVFDSQLWQTMKTNLVEFYRKCVLPELFNLKVKRGILE